MPKPLTSHAMMPGVPAATNRPADGLLKRIVMIFRGLLKWHRARMTVRDLAKLDDRMLSDLGLTRADVNRAMLKGDDHDTVRSLEDARFINATHRFRK